VESLTTPRLVLVPITLPLVEAVWAGRRDEAEAILGARFPMEWPGRALVERAFCCPIERLRQDPASTLWGGRVMVLRCDNPAVVGSVITSGSPDERGTVSVGYGVEAASQGQGFATEAVAKVVEWSLAQSSVFQVTATTFPWNRPSLRVLDKVGMHFTERTEHDMLGEMWVFARDRQHN
jgi:ribosomal-protein-alanine N-acetyltransferase